MASHAYIQMSTSITNIATCITQVTLKMVNYTLFMNYLWFGVVFLEFQASFPTNKHGLDCGLCFETKILTMSVES